MLTFDKNCRHYSPESYRRLLADTLAIYMQVQQETVSLPAALGRVTHRAIKAHLPSPPFDNSQMDGYALTSRAATRKQRVFTVGQDIPAGFSGVVDVNDDIAYPIMTGAPLPAGYNAVVPVERSLLISGNTDQQGFVPCGGLVELPITKPGNFVRRVGDDVQAGAMLMDAATRLGPAHLGVLAGHGIATVEVLASLRVLIYTGGEEISSTPQLLRPGTIYDANAPMLTALLHATGVTDVQHRQISDDPAVFTARLKKDLTELAPDLIITCGGISAGKYEVVRNTLGLLTSTADNLSAESWFGHVAQQPGGPQGVSLLKYAGKHVPMVCLPGNPVSTLVSYTVLLRPVLAELDFATPSRPLDAYLDLEPGESLRAPARKTQFRRGIAGLEQATETGINLRVQVHGGAGSHLLQAASASNVLIELAPDLTYTAGDAVKIHSIPGTSLL